MAEEAPLAARRVAGGEARGEAGPRAAQQVALALTLGGDGRIELALDPEDLGRVRLSMTPTETGIAVHLAADRGETLDLLRRHADDLARELRQAGYGEASFRFGAESGADHGTRRSAAYLQVAGRPDPSASAQVVTPTPTARVRPGDGMDLRL